MQFKDVIGQEKIKQRLISSVKGGRMPHAQIFLGPQGSGNLSLAIAFAQFVLCEQPTENDSCGTCRSCNKVGKLIHPDVHFSYPTVGSKMVSTHFLKQWRASIASNSYLEINQWLQALDAENKQGNITRDECVDIIKKLSFKTFEGTHKILIMWLPEYLGKEGNRLLKLIEEPPENTLFILVAENQELILNTILSRCQLLTMNKLKHEDIVHALVARKQVEEQEAQRIAFLADGNFTEALSLIGNATNDNATGFLKWFRVCYLGKATELVEWVDEFAKLGRENQKQFLRYALHFLREYMVIKLVGDAKARLQPNELTTAQKMTKVIEYEQIEPISTVLNNCFYYIERNAHPKVLFLDASIQINKILKGKK